MKNSAYACIFGSVVASSVPFASAAAQTVNGGGVNPSASTAAMSGANLSEIVVTAQRRTERLKDVPVAVTVHSAAQLRAANVSNARDLVLVTPGLRIEGNGINAQPALRGVSSTNGSTEVENNVVTYIDGVYQPTQIGAFFSLPDVEQVQVLKGPQGSLYGRNATGGVILVDTKSPSFKPQADIGVDYTAYGHGSGGGVQANAFVTGPLVGDILAGSLMAYNSYLDSYVRNIVTGHNQPADHARIVRTKLLFKPTDGVRIQGGFVYTNVKDGTDLTYLSYKGRNSSAGLPGAVVADQPWTTSSDVPGDTAINEKEYSLKGDFDTPMGTLTSVTAYVDYTSRHQQDADYTNLNLGAYKLSVYSRSFTQDIFFTSNPFGPFSLIVGGTYYHRDSGDVPLTVGPFNDPATDIPIYDHAVSKSLSEYIELTWHVTDKLKIIGGGRYTHDSNTGFVSFFSPDQALLGRTTSDKFTPRAAIMYDLTPHMNVYYNYSQGFKAGLFNTAAGQKTPVLPEKLTAHEIGLKYSSPLLTFNAAAFHYNYDDLQVTTNAQGTGLSELLNAASAKIYGVDIDATVRPLEDFSLTLGASYLHARYSSFKNASITELPTDPNFDGRLDNTADLSGQTMIRSPTFTLSAIGDYHHDFAAGRLNFSVNGFYSTEVRMALESRVTQGQYFVGNARIGWTPANRDLTVSLYTRNFTNSKVIASTFVNLSADAVIYNPPRQFGVAINYAFR